MVDGCEDVLVGVNLGIFDGSVISMASELEEADCALAFIFLQFLSALIARLSVPAGKLSSASVPPEELDGTADEASAIFSLGTGKGFGGSGGVGLGDGGFLGGIWAEEAAAVGAHWGLF